MLPAECFPSRRSFLKTSAVFAAGFSGLPLLAQPPDSEEPNTVVGPKKGYSPEIGTLTSMMAFMRWQVLNSVKGMSQQDLDFLLDAKANRIGALLMHLAAVESFYQLNTFEGLAPKTMPKEFRDKWGVPQELGGPAREAIKGHSLDFYLNLLNDTREKTLSEFRKRDDKWLMAVDQTWGWGPTNNYCKWFHVTEHEANHNGQIKLLKSRLPGAKPVSE
jgi:uncharacterized protein DUF664